jgi:NAD-dependent SIR2 family protein deacetylase
LSYRPDQDNIIQLSKEYAESTRRTIFFVGAGASMEVGMPSWSGLRSALLQKISRAVDDAGSNPDELENYRELEEISNNNDRFWDFFQLASSEWSATYNDFMLEQFDNKINQTPIPIIYKRLWKMRRLRQIFTLNVDTLVTRAFHSVYSNKNQHQLLEFDGYNVSDSLSFLSRDNYCVVNLHGTYPHKSRWIMDSSQRSQLMSGPIGAKYTSYVIRLFLEYNIVFVGLNPADVAISPFLTKAKEAGVLGRHYWICPNPTPDVVKWTQKNNIRLIVYSPDLNEKNIPAHSQDICAILDQIEEYKSIDNRVTLPSSALSIEPRSILKPIEELKIINSNRDDGTKRLAGAISWIGEENGYSSRELSQFLNDYKVPLQISSMLDAETEGFNEVNGYSIRHCLQSGGASSVWLVDKKIDSDNSYYAMKALSPDSLTSLPIRQSFRRGIESLYLLSTSNTKVAPQYISHSELPLSVVMEFITGATLSEFLSNFKKLQPIFILRLFRKICEAVRACHISEGKVLHRDIKPGNVMLEGWHPGYEIQDAEDSVIRLINFDLSWHRFTSGDTKSISAEDIGYYAPEQRNSINSLPPRSAETDIYMLGMVLYYICSRKLPPDGGSGLTDWPALVQKAMRSQFPDELVRARMVRLTLEMTYLDMSDRVDLSNVIAEIEGLIFWIENASEKIDDDFLVEYLAILTGRYYFWDRSALFAKINANESTDMTISYIQKGQRASVEFFRQKSGADQRGTFGQKMSEKISHAANVLKESGWDITLRSSRGLNAEIRISKLRSQQDFGAESWKKASSYLLASFE